MFPQAIGLAGTWNPERVAAYANGPRGDHHPVYLKSAPTLKHFLGYNNETDRCTSSSDLRASGRCAPS